MTISVSRSRAGWAAVGLVGAGLAAGLVLSQLGVAGAAPADARHGLRMGPHHAMPGGAMPGGPGPEGFLGGRVLHGQATVRTPDGDKVFSMQNGTVSALGGSSVTVRSTDGFTRTYTVDGGTRIVLDGDEGALSSLDSGDRVRVIGVQDGDDWTAKAVLSGLGDHPMLHRWHEMRDRSHRPGQAAA